MFKINCKKIFELSNIPSAHQIVATSSIKFIKGILKSHQPENLYEKISIPSRICKVATVKGMSASHSYFNIGLKLISKMPSNIIELKGKRFKSPINSPIIEETDSQMGIS